MYGLLPLTNEPNVPSHEKHGEAVNQPMHLSSLAVYQFQEDVGKVSGIIHNVRKAGMDSVASFQSVWTTFLSIWLPIIINYGATVSNKANQSSTLWATDSG